MSATTHSVSTEDSTSKFLRVGGYNIHFHEAGTGEAVIMLHGGGPGANGYSNFHPNFDAFSARYRTFLVDMLGYGLSDDGDFTTESRLIVQPRVLKDMLDELGIERASFVGNSLGGTTSLAFAADYPERTNRLVLMGPAGFLYPPVYHPAPSEGHRRLAEAAANPTPEAFRALAAAMLYDPSVMSEEAIAARVAVAQRRLRDKAAAPGATKNVPERALREELYKVAAETLIIWGKDDRVNPYEIGIQLMRDLDDATMVIFKNCGHWAQAERPKEFNRIALEFLAS
jgi:pimeloyl-ACP methyl ester carboxylesterase